MSVKHRAGGHMMDIVAAVHTLIFLTRPDDPLGITKSMTSSNSKRAETSERVVTKAMACKGHHHQETA